MDGKKRKTRPRERNNRTARGTNGPVRRSKLEDNVAGQLERAKVVYEYESESCKINYLVPSSSHIYTCDFILHTRTGKQIFIEAKGIWDYDDRYKHLLIRKQHPEIDIRFVFLRASNKIRKGSKTTYADICNGLGRGMWKDNIWKYSDGGKVPKGWYDE